MPAETALQDMASESVDVQQGVDNTWQDSSIGSAPPSPKHLPPRVVVQNPNGDVSLGEDAHRLRHETADAHRKQQARIVSSLQPGGNRWLHIAFQAYATTLHNVLSSRKRLMLTPVGVVIAQTYVHTRSQARLQSSVLQCMQQTQLIVCLSTDQMVIWSAWCDWDLQLEAWCRKLSRGNCIAGVDMGAMLWPVICIVAQKYGLDMGAKETLPTWAVLSVSSTCIMLDVATLLACAQDSPTVLFIITLAHAPLYASMYASHLSYNLWILTKVFVVIFTLRVCCYGLHMFLNGEHIWVVLDSMERHELQSVQRCLTYCTPDCDKFSFDISHIRGSLAFSVDTGGD